MSETGGIVPEELLEILRCPADRGELVERLDPPRLVCGTCGRGYRVEDGIPNMLLEEALPPEPERS